METEIVISSGLVRGTLEGGVARFCAIPYAAPPYGANRFRAPQPVVPWDGIRDGTTFGPNALKPPQPEVFEKLLPDPDVPGEDCLTLNVWSPQQWTDAMPVLVWVHGGGYLTGSGAVPIYDGAAFARHGVICVTINYRLGIDGFAMFEDAPPNRGLLDIVAALEWVQAEIVRFGGDPARVTIAGQSAGAMAVMSVLTMPSAAGLFTRAIAQSGAGHNALSRATALQVSAEIAAELGVAATASAFSRIDDSELLGAFEQVSDRIATAVGPEWDEVRERSLALQPVIDGEVLPALPFDAIAVGVGADVDMLIGTNTDEFTLWSVPTGLSDALDEAAVQAALVGLGAEPDLALSTYRASDPGADDARIYAQVMTDWAFRMPALRIAECRHTHRAQTFVYEFCWPSPLDPRLGATHASEVAFTFDNLGVDWARALRGDTAPQSLADEMHRAWLRFISKGDAGWEAYGVDHVVRRFGGKVPVVADPDMARTDIWRGLR